nr:PREDICTED: uncharacterized protein LOC109457457 [Rhinolophus sinicus]
MKQAFKNRDRRVSFISALPANTFHQVSITSIRKEPHFMVETRRLRKGLPKGTKSREYNTALRRESQMIRTSSHIAQSSAAAFCSASGPSPNGLAGEAAEGRRIRPRGGARRAGASRALSKGHRQPGGGCPALSLSLCSSRCPGFQAVRCHCAPCRRRAAQASRSRLAHAGPHSTGESLAYPCAPGRWSPSEHEVRSPPPAPPPTSLGAPLPAAACASSGSHAPPAGRRVLCQLATHGIDCPRLPRLERVAFPAWQGRGARHPRRFADPARARVSLLGSPLRGRRQYPRERKSTRQISSAILLGRSVSPSCSWL